MFLDASAMVAILAAEAGWEGLAEKVEGSRRTLTSPLAIWETVIALVRTRAIAFEIAEDLVRRFLIVGSVEIVPVTAGIGRLAIDASRLYGRGRHRAGLNFGDCFAYACAKSEGVPLLFKGDDFGHTDVPVA